MHRRSLRLTRLLFCALFLAGCSSGIKQDVPVLDDIQPLVATGSNTTVQIVHSFDDAEQNNNTGAVTLINTALTLGAKTGVAQTVGLRFQNVGIPKGATITSAVLEFKAATNQTALTKLTIAGENTDFAFAYSAAANGIRSRVKVPVTAAWQPSAWTTGGLYQSVDLAGVAQAIINRPGWFQGNTLAFQITGTGARQAVSFNGGAAGAPKLIVNYTYDTDTSPTFLSRSVGQATDDAEQPGNSAVVTASPALELGKNGTISQTVGMRFSNLTIPPGARIDSAQIEMTVSAADTSATAFTIVGEASDSAATYTTAAASISSRSKTAAEAWKPVPWTLGSNFRTVQLNTLLQEIVNRPGWASGNAAAFMITGTGTRRAVAYDSSPAKAPRLVVSYTPGATPPPPPPVDPCSSFSGTVPAPWQSADVGTVGTAGRAASTSDTFDLCGYGSGLGETTDAFHFVNQTLTGDGTLTARIVSLDAATADAQAGVMIRESLDAGSKYASVTVDGANQTAFASRGGTTATSLAGMVKAVSERASPTSTTTSVADMLSTVQRVAGSVTAQGERLTTSYWVRVTRKGASLNGYTSADGQTWTLSGTATVTMKQDVQVGLWTTSQGGTTPAQAIFDNLTVEDLPEVVPLPSPWERGDIGTLTTPGTSSFASDTFQLGAKATGLGEQTDALHYVHQPLTQDGSLTVHISGLADDAKAGLTIRNALTADAPHASLWVQGKQGVPSFVSRELVAATSGASTLSDLLATGASFEDELKLANKQAADALASAQASVAPPAASHWLRLTRRGDAVGAFTSMDGQVWQQVGYETLTTSSSATIGFWVAGKIGSISASIDNVSFGGPVGELYNPGEPIEILLNPWQGATIGTGTGNTGIRNDNALYSLSARGGTNAAPVTEFMYRQERSGDALYVSVSELRALEEDGAVGLMIRDSLATNASYTFLKVTPKGIVLEKSQNGALSETLLQPARRTLPLWLRIASAGDTVTVYQTQDVVTWEAIGSAQVSLGSTRYLGIAARSSGGEVTGAFTRPRLIHLGDDTLTGVDSDGNGVRDDLQNYIEVNFPSAGQAPIRDAFTEVARSGGAILANGADAAALDGYYSAQDAARQLLGEANEYQLGLLESEIFDTPDRLIHFLTAADAAAQSIASSNRASETPAEVGQAENDRGSQRDSILEAMAEGCPTGSSLNKGSVVLFNNRLVPR